MRNWTIVIAFLVLAGCGQEPVPEPDFWAPTADGRRVAGDIHADTTLGLKPLVLLFHQDNTAAQAEYERIIPRLLAEGYHAISADLRTGGDLFGGVNRTALPADTSASFCSVYPDLEGILDYARREAPSRKPILWGSSFSATLALQLAAEHPDQVAGVVSFSPAGGNPMEGCRPEPFADALAMPALIVRPSNEAAVPHVAEQIGTFTSQGHRVYIASPGRHGASSLDPERVGASVEETWQLVLDYMRRLETETSP